VGPAVLVAGLRGCTRVENPADDLDARRCWSLAHGQVEDGDLVQQVAPRFGAREGALDQRHVPGLDSVAERLPGVDLRHRRQDGRSARQLLQPWLGPSGQVVGEQPDQRWLVVVDEPVEALDVVYRSEALVSELSRLEQGGGGIVAPIDAIASMDFCQSSCDAVWISRAKPPSRSTSAMPAARSITRAASGTESVDRWLRRPRLAVWNFRIGKESGHVGSTAHDTSRDDRALDRRRSQEAGLRRCRSLRRGHQVRSDTAAVRAVPVLPPKILAPSVLGAVLIVTPHDPGVHAVGLAA